MLWCDAEEHRRCELTADPQAGIHKRYVRCNVRGPSLDKEKSYKSPTGASRFPLALVLCTVHLQFQPKMQAIYPTPALTLALCVASSAFASPIINNSTQKQYTTLDNDWGSTGFIPYLLALDAGIEVLTLASCPSIQLSNIA